jgi:hypothetical protein
MPPGNKDLQSARSNQPRQQFVHDRRAGTSTSGRSRRPRPTREHSPAGPPGPGDLEEEPPLDPRDARRHRCRKCAGTASRGGDRGGDAEDCAGVRASASRGACQDQHGDDLGAPVLDLEGPAALRIGGGNSGRVCSHGVRVRGRPGSREFPARPPRPTWLPRRDPSWSQPLRSMLPLARSAPIETPVVPEISDSFHVARSGREAYHEGRWRSRSGRKMMKELMVGIFLLVRGDGRETVFPSPE